MGWVDDEIDVDKKVHWHAAPPAVHNVTACKRKEKQRDSKISQNETYTQTSPALWPPVGLTGQQKEEEIKIEAAEVTAGPPRGFKLCAVVAHPLKQQIRDTYLLTLTNHGVFRIHKLF